MKISVVVPVYNLEQYIDAILDSLHAQTDKNFEAIIVDDGSKDDSHQKVLKSTENAAFDCKVFSIENGGVSRARNFGIAEATGDYILLIDGDDYLSADCIESIRASDENGKADIICWGYNEVNEDGSVYRRYFDRFESDFDWMYGEEALNNMMIHKTLWIWSGSAAYKREFLEREGIGFTTDYKCGEDQEFTVKALGRAKTVRFINKVMSYYLQRGNSVTHSYNTRRLDIVGALDRAYAFIDAAPSEERQAAYDAYKIGHYFYNLNSCIESKGVENTNEVLRDVDKDLPGLNDQVIAAMKRYEGNDTHLKKRIDLFLSSPVAYAEYMRDEGNAWMEKYGWYIG
ncbi:glycosyltransferase family 2 protein [Planococcus lenghuensis]|uniref:Glycosyltransferase 2-like domain-containing protein n=1 Tax=Planococcus lenghuensis TaxID=2213202 RepID=A0A1Q2L0W9_9BACL|nr:glycosyltransferase family 2 protein [Planococcus lenghuensis]AQQ54063.1 hypothetical protein B0X71_13775 [Planococcus lenghuensis]